jgi:hypothetical protein
MIWMVDVTPAIQAALGPRATPTWHREIGNTALAVFEVRQLMQSKRWVLAAADRGATDWTAVRMTYWPNEKDDAINEWVNYLNGGGSVAAWASHHAEQKQFEFPALKSY